MHILRAARCEWSVYALGNLRPARNSRTRHVLSLLSTRVHALDNTTTLLHRRRLMLHPMLEKSLHVRPNAYKIRYWSLTLHPRSAMKRRKIAKMHELSPDESSGPSAPRQETVVVSRFRELTDKRIGRRMHTVIVPDIPTDDHGDQDRTDDDVEPDDDPCNGCRRRERAGCVDGRSDGRRRGAYSRGWNERNSRSKCQFFVRVNESSLVEVARRRLASLSRCVPRRDARARRQSGARRGWDVPDRELQECCGI